MAETCQYCWQEVELYGHIEGCPIQIGTPGSMQMWERGRSYGLADDYLPWWERINHNPEFILGFRAGKLEVDPWSYKSTKLWF